MLANKKKKENWTSRLTFIHNCILYLFPYYVNSTSNVNNLEIYRHSIWPSFDCRKEMVMARLKIQRLQLPILLWKWDWGWLQCKNCLKIMSKGNILQPGKNNESVTWNVLLKSSIFFFLCLTNFCDLAIVLMLSVK
jgi:hypothetical protein